MKTRDYGLFWLIGLLWGTSFLWIKIAVEDVSPLVLVAFRTLFGAGGLGLVILFSRNIDFHWKDIRKHAFDFFVLGLINITLPFVLVSSAEQVIDSGTASILNAANPLFTILLSPIFIRDDRITWPKALGLVVGFIGVYLLMAPSLGGRWNANLGGQFMMLGATLCYAAGSIYARIKSPALPATVSAFLQVAASTVITWIIVLFTEKPLVLPAHGITWVAFAWLGLLGTAIAYIIYFHLLHRIGPTRVSMITYIPPLVGVILGIIFLGESFYWQAILGGALILSGITLVKFQPAAAD